MPLWAHARAQQSVRPSVRFSSSRGGRAKNALQSATWISDRSIPMHSSQRRRVAEHQSGGAVTELRRSVGLGHETLCMERRLLLLINIMELAGVRVVDPAGATPPRLSGAATPFSLSTLLRVTCAPLGVVALFPRRHPRLRPRPDSHSLLAHVDCSVIRRRETELGHPPTHSARSLRRPFGVLNALTLCLCRRWIMNTRGCTHAHGGMGSEGCSRYLVPLCSTFHHIVSWVIVKQFTRLRERFLGLDFNMI